MGCIVGFACGLAFYLYVYKLFIYTLYIDNKKLASVKLICGLFYFGSVHSEALLLME